MPDMRVFCPQPLASQPIQQHFLFKFAPGAPIGGLFKENLPENFFQKQVVYVDSAPDADVIVLPSNFVRLDEEALAYIKRYADLGDAHKKPVYLFACGDYSSELIFDPRVFVFRYSMYRSAARERDISTPTLTEDIGKEGITFRQKKEKPTVSFCGKAGFASMRERISSYLKRVPLEIAALTNPTVRARVRGVFWRMAALRVCERSNLIDTLFIIRKSFSGALKTIELDPEQARKEFISSINDADFVLAPKGDGNYSNRFLESLAMGRIPVHIDTDAILPFEGEIDYSKIAVIVPMKDISRIPQLVRAFYDRMSQEEWQIRQQAARETFENYLRQDSFFKHYFAQVLAN